MPEVKPRLGSWGRLPKAEFQWILKHGEPFSRQERAGSVTDRRKRLSGDEKMQSLTSE